MKFCALVLELHLRQNVCHTHRDTQTHRQIDRQTFSRNSQIVFRTFQNVYIHQKTEIENLQETNTFFFLHRRIKDEKIKAFLFVTISQYSLTRFINLRHQK